MERSITIDPGQHGQCQHVWLEDAQAVSLC
jgi:hypothetical protein